MFPILSLLLSSFFSDTLFLEGESIGYLEDIPYIVDFIVFGWIVFLSFAFFGMFQTFFIESIPNLIEDMKNPGLHRDYLQRISKQINGKGKYANVKFGVYIIGTIGIIWWVFFYAWLNIRFPHDAWRFFPSYPLNYVLSSTLYITILGFIILPLGWRLLSCVYALNRFCREYNQDITLVSLHPDGVGGMGPWGSSILYFVVIVQLPIISLFFSMQYWGIVQGSYLSLIYFPILTVISFITLFSSHKLIRDHKRQELEQLRKGKSKQEKKSEGGKHEVESSHTTVNERSSESTRTIEEVENAIHYFEEMSNWPFSVLLTKRLRDCFRTKEHNGGYSPSFPFFFMCHNCGQETKIAGIPDLRDMQKGTDAIAPLLFKCTNDICGERIPFKEERIICPCGEKRLVYIPKQTQIFDIHTSDCLCEYEVNDACLANKKQEDTSRCEFFKYYQGFHTIPGELEFTCKTHKFHIGTWRGENTAIQISCNRKFVNHNHWLAALFSRIGIYYEQKKGHFCRTSLYPRTRKELATIMMAFLISTLLISIPCFIYEIFIGQGVAKTKCKDHLLFLNSVAKYSRCNLQKNEYFLILPS